MTNLLDSMLVYKMFGMLEWRLDSVFCCQPQHQRQHNTMHWLLFRPPLSVAKANSASFGTRIRIAALQVATQRCPTESQLKIPSIASALGR